MKLTRAEIDGGSALVGELQPGMVKAVFDDGRVIIGFVPHKDLGSPVDKSGDKYPLYVSRRLKNPEALIKWAKKQGFAKVVEDKDLHVTIAYSSKPVDVASLTPDTKEVVVRGGTRQVAPLGSEGAVVLMFNSVQLSAEWKSILKAGASWDYDGYHPHVTITYNVDPDFDLTKVKPYTGPLIFGEQLFEELDTDWKDTVVEKSNPNHEPAGSSKGGQFASKPGNTQVPIKAPGRAPSVGSLVKRWYANGGEWEQFQQAARALIGVDELVPYASQLRAAQILLDEIHASPIIDKTLFRGLSYAEGFDNIKVGDTFSESLASWTEHADLANQFAANSFGSHVVQNGNYTGRDVMLMLKTDNARGFSVSAYAPKRSVIAEADEWITSGRYRVIRIAETRQYVDGVYVTGSVGLPVIEVERIGDASSKDIRKEEQVEKSNECHDPHTGQFCSGGKSFSNFGDELGTEPPPVGTHFKVFRVGAGTPHLDNKNAGNAEAIAEFLSQAADPDSPISTKGDTVSVFDVVVGAPFTHYLGANHGEFRGESSNDVGRVTRGQQRKMTLDSGESFTTGKSVSYSFPKGGNYQAKKIASISLQEIHNQLKNTYGFLDFDESGYGIGAKLLRELFKKQVEKQGDDTPLRPLTTSAPSPRLIPSSPLILSRILKYSETQPRKPKGDPDGGQFARTAGSGPDAGSSNPDGGRAGKDLAGESGKGRTVHGVHYSRAQRDTLDGSHFGSGMRSAELNRVLGSEDPRTKQRIYAYIDTGVGIVPESGVGGVPHAVTFKNMYDLNTDPDGIYQQACKDSPYPGMAANLFESMLLDKGYNGYFHSQMFTRKGRQGVMVLLGDATKAFKPDNVSVKGDLGLFDKQGVVEQVYPGLDKGFAPMGVSSNKGVLGGGAFVATPVLSDRLGGSSGFLPFTATGTGSVVDSVLKSGGVQLSAILKWSEGQHPRDDNGRFVKRSFGFGQAMRAWHGTQKEVLDKILKEGLQVQPNHNFGAYFYDTPGRQGVYITTDLHTAKAFADTASRTAFEHDHNRPPTDDADFKEMDGNAIVLRLEIPQSYVKRKSHPDRMLEASYIFPQGIKPQWIRGALDSRGEVIFQRKAEGDLVLYMVIAIEAPDSKGLSSVLKFNPHHEPGGSSRGGQFTSAPGGASLPMDKESRLSRAKDMGFDTDHVWFHGTFNDFDAFKKANANSEAYWGAGAYFSSSPKDVNKNYVNPNSPDWEAKIDAKAEALEQEVMDKIEAEGGEYEYTSQNLAKYRRLAKKEIMETGGIVMETFLRMKKPLDEFNENDTFSLETKYNEEGDVVSEEGSANRLFEAIHKVAKDWPDAEPNLVGNLWGQLSTKFDDWQRPTKAYDVIGSLSTLPSAMNMEWESAHSGKQFRHKVMRELGYDGVIMDACNAFVWLNLPKGTKHAVVFNPANIRSIFAKFDPKDSKSTKIMKAPSLVSVLKANPYHEPGGSSKGGQFAKKPGGSSTPPVDDIGKIGSFDAVAWKAKGMMVARNEWKRLSREEKDAYGNPRENIPARVKELLAGVGDYPNTGDTAKDIQQRLDSLADRMPAESRKLTAEFIQTLNADLVDAGVDKKVARDLSLEALDHTSAQDIEAYSRTLGDHGVHHLKGDADIAKEIISVLPGKVDTPHNRALMSLVAVYHDVGYLTPPSRSWLDADHPRWGAQYFNEKIAPKVEKVFGKDMAQLATQLIASHDHQGIDWDNEPELSAFSTADNVALFHREKMPPMLRYVPKNVQVLVGLGTGKTKLDDAKDQMRKNITDSNLTPKVKEQLLAAVEEVSGVLPKFTLGMVGASLDKVSWKDDHVNINVKRRPSNEALAKVLDLGQKQFGKLAETYGGTTEQFVKDKYMTLRSNSGTPLLSFTILDEWNKATPYTTPTFKVDGWGSVASVLKYNGKHYPSGSHRGGQFAPKAQSGQSTNPQTDTQSFKGWFKDSIVVNADGSPKRVFHGTNADFDTFDISGLGEHFGSAEAANDRINNLRDFSVDVVHRDPGAFNMMPVFLSLTNPLRMRDQAEVMEEYDSGEGEKEQYARNWEDPESVALTLLDDGVIDIDEYDSGDSETSANASLANIRTLLKSKGYDGIVYRNAVEDAGNDSYIVFDPEQIKSAVGNTGAFSPKDKRITKFSKVLKFYVSDNVRGNKFHGDDGQFIGVGGIQMVSPSVVEGSKYNDALEGLRSQRHQDVMREMENIDRISGFSTDNVSTVGAWKDGAENSVLVAIKSHETYEEVRLNAAMKGMLADQKAVIPFLIDPKGKDTMYEFTIESTDLKAINQKLVELGAENHTLQPRGKKTSVWLYDPGSESTATMQQVGEHYGAKVNKWKGQGEFLGDWDSRTEGRRKYQEAIEVSGIGPDRGRRWEELYSRWRETHEALKVEGLASVFKYNKNHDKLGRFASTGGSVDKLITQPFTFEEYLAGKTKPIKPNEFVAPHPRLNEDGVNKVLEEVGLTMTAFFDANVFGNRIRMPGDGDAQRGVRIGLPLMREAIRGLPSETQNAIKTVRPHFCLSDYQNALGVTEGASGTTARKVAFNFSRLSRISQGLEPEDCDLLKNATKGPQGAYSLSADVWKDYTGSNGAEIVAQEFKNTVVHELGHVLTSESTQAQAKLGLFNHSKDAVRTFSWVVKKVSPYATANVMEFIAESFLKYHRPDYTPGSMPKWWENMVESMNTPANYSKKAEVAANVVRPLKNTPKFLSDDWFTDGRDIEADAKYTEDPQEPPAGPTAPSGEGGHDTTKQDAQKASAPSQKVGFASILKYEPLGGAWNEKVVMIGNPYQDAHGRFTNKANSVRQRYQGVKDLVTLHRKKRPEKVGFLDVLTYAFPKLEPVFHRLVKTDPTPS